MTKMGGGRVLQSLAFRGGTKRSATATEPLVSISAPSSPPSSATSSPLPELAAALSEAAEGWRDLREPFMVEQEGWESDEKGEEGEEGNGMWFGERLDIEKAPSDEEVAEAVSTMHQVFDPFRFPAVVEDGTFSTHNEDHVNETSTKNPFRFPAVVEEGNSFTNNEDHLNETSTSDRKNNRNFQIGSRSQQDWIEPPLLQHKYTNVQSRGQSKLIDALHSLETNPAVETMFVSLSSDKDVWHAVMKNEAVKELTKPLYTAEGSITPKRYDSPEVAARIPHWRLRNTFKMVMKLVEKIARLVNELLRPNIKRRMRAFGDVIKSSFTLSVIVFIIVIMSRLNSPIISSFLETCHLQQEISYYPPPT